MTKSFTTDFLVYQEKNINGNKSHKKANADPFLIRNKQKSAIKFSTTLNKITQLLP